MMLEISLSLMVEFIMYPSQTSFKLIIPILEIQQKVNNLLVDNLSMFMQKEDMLF